MASRAAELSPGSTWYVVTTITDHWSLRKGDLVQVVKPPPYGSNKYLYRRDGTLHECRGLLNRHVLLEEAPKYTKSKTSTPVFDSSLLLIKQELTFISNTIRQKDYILEENYLNLLHSADLMIEVTLDMLRKEPSDLSEPTSPSTPESASTPQ